MASTKKLDKVLFSGESKPLNPTTGELKLMGTWEVSKYLGVEKSRIARWLGELRQGKTPIAPPVATLKSGSFWLFEDVQDKLQDMYTTLPNPDGLTLKDWVKKRREDRAGLNG